jgi:hypothetical protein
MTLDYSSDGLPKTVQITDICTVLAGKEYETKTRTEMATEVVRIQFLWRG